MALSYFCYRNSTYPKLNKIFIFYVENSRNYPKSSFA